MQHKHMLMFLHCREGRSGVFIFTVNLLFNCSVFVLGKGPLIRHFLSFGPIPEPIIYIMVNGLYAQVVNV